LEEESVDLVLMDINLKGEMDGIDAASEIHNRFRIPVLFLTAFANKEVIERAREVGAFGYLIKPFKACELQAMVEVALYKHKSDIEKGILEKRMQRALKYESLQVMAGGVAHQFNNTLHAVLGNLSFALEALPRESPARHGLMEAEKAAWKAAELSKQMLAFSGQGFIRTAELELSTFIGQLKHLLKALLPSSSVLSLDLEDGLPFVMADPAHLKQVIVSLMINAVEAIGEKSGVVSVKTSQMECSKEYLTPLRLGKFLREGRYVFIEVTDTGCGMAASVIQKVFDPFFSTKFTGRGIGLPSSLGLVQAHQGTISITREPDVSTTVRVLLPACETDPDDPARKPG
ncbi:MAG: response regulator, partial [bacterium]|nr:response regulator [bacterium]